MAKEITEQNDGDEGLDTLSSKKNGKLIIIAVLAIVLLAGGGGGLYFMGIIPPQKETKKEDKAKASDEAEQSGKKGKTSEKTARQGPPVYVDLDNFLVNLNTSGKQSRFLKMSVALEMKNKADQQAIEPYLPRIRDSFQMYLRELRVEDLSGSAATYRLKEELMLRLVKVVYPLEVQDILFKEFIVQ